MHFLREQIYAGNIFLPAKKMILTVLKNILPARQLVILAKTNDGEMVSEIIRRLNYYAPDLKKKGVEIKVKEVLSLGQRYSASPILSLVEVGSVPNCIQKLFNGIFNVNYEINPVDGWSWHQLLNYMEGPSAADLRQSNERLAAYIAKINDEGHNKCYIYGTGSSLEKAINREWSDGYRVVCNTIVRDQALWRHVNPHFIVAGDAIYHFGHTEFAKAFRRDLLERLQESETMFVYPSIFHTLVKRMFSAVEDRLVPIDKGTGESFNINLTSDFRLPALGNVLGLLLLPLACTLSKNVYMIGFDGRAPDDKLFWSNSDKHSYPELIHTLREAHPKFFRHFISTSEPNSYVKSVHGDKLDSLMTKAEEEGWRFVMMHKSWTDTFQKRYVEGLL